MLITVRAITRAKREINKKVPRYSINSIVSICKIKYYKAKIANNFDQNLKPLRAF